MVVDFRERSVDIVAEAVVESEPPPRFPVVLHIEAWLPHAVVRSKQAGAARYSGKCPDKKGRKVLGRIAGISWQAELVPAICIVALYFPGLAPDQRCSGLDRVLAKVVGHSSIVLE